MSDIHGEKVHVHDGVLGGGGLDSFKHDLDREAAQKFYQAAKDRGEATYTSPGGEKIKFIHNKETDQIEIHKGHHNDH
mgnify:CR=1 FL=1